MGKQRIVLAALPLLWVLGPIKATAQCDGHFLNPVTDICWSCLFPLSIGSATVAPGDNPDTDNPDWPAKICESDLGYRLGLTIGYWEPFAVTDVTRTPYCLVSLGGVDADVGLGGIEGATQAQSTGTTEAFYQVHWYKYPLISWLNVLTSVGCMESGDYDVGYLTELDPTWDDDELAFILNPEAVLFGNPAAQMACLADATAAAVGSSINSLFWCMGSQGSSYPLTGHISAEFSVLQNSTLLTERMAYKLHREGLVEDSSGKDSEVCTTHVRAIIPKDRYRYQMVSPTPDSQSCHPFGHTTATWQTGKLTPADKGNYSYLVTRKRNCVFM